MNAEVRRYGDSLVFALAYVSIETSKDTYNELANLDPLSQNIEFGTPV